MALILMMSSATKLAYLYKVSKTDETSVYYTEN